MNNFTLKITICLLLLGGLFSSCNSNKNNDSKLDDLQDQITALQDSVQKIQDEYKPGLGELMATIEYHHAKLWFAGIYQNWPLANFEIGEINETLTTAKEIETDRPEIKDIPMIYPALDSLQQAVDKKDVTAFRSGFQLLTTTCNNCHTANKFHFNVIKIPDMPPVPNQQFRPQ